MIRKLLIISGGVLTIVWGIAHVVPTGTVVGGFGHLSADNTRIITMEWITEGLTLMFIGTLVVAVTIFGESLSKTAKIVYLTTFIMLEAMSLLSLFTGFWIEFLPFKLCPVIFTVSGLLILQGVFRRNNK
jgi:hypothetical protein